MAKISAGPKQLIFCSAEELFAPWRVNVFVQELPPTGPIARPIEQRKEQR
jgi:hypothetical protein